jgi:diguanylate cyclase (GGDEF)-like protein
LSSALGALAAAATQDFAIDELLGQLCETAGSTLAVDGAGVMSFDDDRSRFVQASDPPTAMIGRLQEELQSGPGWDAIQSCTPVSAGSTAEMLDRWPAVARAARNTGLNSLLVVPLVARGRCWGSLDLYRRAGGGWRPDEVAAAQLLADVAASYLVMAADRDQARSAQLELAGQALHDQLTGLPNRVLMFELISHALAAGDRNGTPVAVLFIDLDRFKAVNDTFGHKAGDTVLTTVTQRMSAVLRATDTLGRLAGDEFLVLLADFSDPSGTAPEVTLAAVADRLREAIKVPISVGDERIRISGSIGAVTTLDSPPATELIHDADTAMYQAKTAGRDRVVLHASSTRSPLDRRRHLERGLLHALERQQLEVHYQPIVTATGQVAAVEALVRWNHPQYGLLAASDFIELAYDNGSVLDIGKWVVQQACRQLQEWRITVADPPGVLFCNLSPQELASPELPAVLQQTLEETGLVPTDLGLEILEADFAHGHLVDLLGAFRDEGHPLAVDDFGTGYSSLARLVELPLTYVKIDRRFVAKLPHDVRSKRLVAAIVTIARQLDITIIAEGIETTEQAEYLISVGCQLLQGFHLGPPAPANQIFAGRSLGGVAGRPAEGASVTSDPG